VRFNRVRGRRAFLRLSSSTCQRIYTPNKKLKEIYTEWCDYTESRNHQRREKEKQQIGIMM
jgi:hypothetical protein